MAGSSNVNEGPIGTRANHTMVSPSVSASRAQPPNWEMSGQVTSPGVPAKTRATRSSMRVIDRSPCVRPSGPIAKPDCCVSRTMEMRSARRGTGSLGAATSAIESSSTNTRLISSTSPARAARAATNRHERTWRTPATLPATHRDGPARSSLET